MQDDIRVENWCGYDIRFIEHNGEWWAILKDICDALGLRAAKVSERLDPDMLKRVEVESIRMRPKHYKENYEVPSKDVVKSKTAVWMLAVNEIGIYEALFASRKLEARKFRRWAAEVMQQLRVGVGLKNDEVFRMADPEVQQTIDEWLFENTFAWKIRRSTGETIVTRTDERGDAVYDA